MDQGRVTRHPLDHPGCAARRIENDDDVTDVIALLRLNYDRVVERYGVPGEESTAGGRSSGAERVAVDR